MFLFTSVFPVLSTVREQQIMRKEKRAGRKERRVGQREGGRFPEDALGA